MFWLNPFDVTIMHVKIFKCIVFKIVLRLTRFTFFMCGSFLSTILQTLMGLFVDGETVKYIRSVCSLVKYIRSVCSLQISSNAKLESFSLRIFWI
jgi:hypothetical protein